MSKIKRRRPPKVEPKIEIVKAPIQLPAPKINTETLSKLVLKGDLSGLSQEQKMEYYLRLCEHLQLDPVTRPFDILNIRGKEIMYAHKGCTDQLRKQNGVSVTDIRGESVGDVYRVTVLGRDHTGRTDAATGVVTVGNLRGDDLANAMMKAETKAKRRLTLSLCGLGMLDESEIETIPDAEIKAVFEKPGNSERLPLEKPLPPPVTPDMSRPALLIEIKTIIETGAFSPDEIAAARGVAKSADVAGLERLRQSLAAQLESRRKTLDAVGEKAFIKPSGPFDVGRLSEEDQKKL